MMGCLSPCLLPLHSLSYIVHLSLQYSPSETGLGFYYICASLPENIKSKLEIAEESNFIGLRKKLRVRDPYPDFFSVLTVIALEEVTGLPAWLLAALHSPAGQTGM